MDSLEKLNQKSRDVIGDASNKIQIQIEEKNERINQLSSGTSPAPKEPEPKPDNAIGMSNQ